MGNGRDEPDQAQEDEAQEEFASAWSEANFPNENKAFVELFTHAVGISSYEFVDASYRYIVAKRRDGAGQLRIHSGLTTGFSEAEARRFGVDAYEVREAKDGTWLVSHPKHGPVKLRGSRKTKAVTPPPAAEQKYFILNQREVLDGDAGSQDEEGKQYHWSSKSSGAWKQLSQASGSSFVYYRTRTASDGTSKSYFGRGTIGKVTETKPDEFVALINDYSKFERPVPSTEGPPVNHQTSIQPIPKEDFENLCRQGHGQLVTTDLTFYAIRTSAVKAGILLDDNIYAQLAAALSSGKHVILTGPPGTAKTKLAEATAKAASEAGKCSGYLLTTATADWTTTDTIGGFRPNGPDLEFKEGHFLKAIRDNQWLLIDELNRSQFDRAFGQLFTVLSNQAVVLPYSRPQAGEKLLVLLPPGAKSPIPDGDILAIPENWRIIATMNVFDKSLLFEMSYALMRRFAFIEVGSPQPHVFETLIDECSGGDDRAASLAKKLLKLRNIKDLGPAVFMDLTRFLRQRIRILQTDEGELLFEAFYSYLLPQFEGIDAATGEELFKLTSKMMATSKDRLRKTLNAVLGLELLDESKLSEAIAAEYEPDEDEVDDEST
jgi:MoxR-like ATPase